MSRQKKRPNYGLTPLWRKRISIISSDSDPSESNSIWNRLQAILEHKPVRTIKIRNNSKLRLWTNNLPPVGFRPLKVSEHELIADRHLGSCSIACEILIAAGPRQLYGLLGGEFKPHDNPWMDIFIGSSSRDSRLFEGSIASPAEVTRIGIPDDYVQSVIDGLELGKQRLTNVGRGCFVIDHGVHGDIGSCEALFKHLSSILLCLLHSDTAKMTDDQIAKLLPDKFV